MSKSPFRMPPKTDAAKAQLDQWVATGGIDAAKTLPAAGAEKKKLARLTIDLPPELHARFKSACALQGTRMIDEVKGFIEQWTQKHGNP